MTYSIAARDPVSGRLGVAVASCVLAIGSRTLWGEPGVGVASVQAGGGPPEFDAIGRTLAEGAPKSLEMLATGASAPRIQVGLVDAQGRAGAHSGNECPAVTEDASNDGATAQGNVLRRPGQARAMLDAWAGRGEAPLEEALVAALRAGEAHGGDARGRQSAALLVVPDAIRETEVDDPEAETLSLRVDDHADPTSELLRLLRVRRAHDALRKGLPLVASDPKTAAAKLGEARATAPEDLLVAQYAVLVLAGIGEEAAAARALAVARRTPGIDARLATLLDQKPWVDLPALRGALEKLTA